MFITLTNHDTSKMVDLVYGVDNCDGNKEIAVHEISYTIKWLNVTGKDYYIDVKKADGHVERSVLPEGYYNFCIMKESLFDPIDIDVSLNRRRHPFVSKDDGVALWLSDGIASPRVAVESHSGMAISGTLDASVGGWR